MTSSQKYYGIEIFPSVPDEGEAFQPVPVEFVVSERFHRIAGSATHKARRDAQHEQLTQVTADAQAILKGIHDDTRGRANAARAREGRANAR